MEKRTDSPVPAARPAGARRWSASLLVAGDRALRLAATASTTGATTSPSSAAWSPRSSAPSKAATVPAGMQQIWVAGAQPRRPLRHLPPGDALEGLRDGGATRAGRTRRSRCRSTRSRRSAAPPATAARAGRSTPSRRTARSRTGRSRCSAAPRRGLLARRRTRRALMQMNCNVCHRYDRETTGADVINLAKELVEREGLPRLPRDQRPRRHDRPRPDLRRRQGARAVRLRPPLGPEDRLRLARRAPQGPARARAGHGDAELPPLHEGRAGARDAGPVLAQGAACRRRSSPARRGTDPQTAEEKRGGAADEDGPGRLVREDRLLRLPLDLGARREEPGADRPGPLDRGRGRAVALRPHGRRLPARADRHDVGRALAPDRPHARGEGGRRPEAARGVRRAPEAEGRRAAEARRRRPADVASSRPYARGMRWRQS